MFGRLFISHLVTAKLVRATRAAVAALAIAYASDTLYEMVRSYGVSSDAVIATAENLNADAYDMAWTIADKLRLSSSDASRSMPDIVLCAPQPPLNPNDALTLAETQDSVVRNLLGSGTEEYAEVKQAIDNGARRIEIELSAASPRYKIIDATLPENQNCNFASSLREVGRVRFRLHATHDPTNSVLSF